MALGTRSQLIFFFRALTECRQDQSSHEQSYEIRSLEMSPTNRNPPWLPHSAEAPECTTSRNATTAIRAAQPILLISPLFERTSAGDCFVRKQPERVPCGVSRYYALGAGRTSTAQAYNCPRPVSNDSCQSRRRRRRKDGDQRRSPGPPRDHTKLRCRRLSGAFHRRVVVSL
jgi:hypothetical protein